MKITYKEVKVEAINNVTGETNKITNLNQKLLFENKDFFYQFDTSKKLTKDSNVEYYFTLDRENRDNSNLIISIALISIQGNFKMCLLYPEQITEQGSCFFNNVINISSSNKNFKAKGKYTIKIFPNTPDRSELENVPNNRKFSFMIGYNILDEDPKPQML